MLHDVAKTRQLYIGNALWLTGVETIVQKNNISYQKNYVYIGTFYIPTQIIDEKQQNLLLL
jgi:hypothetical protein